MGQNRLLPAWAVWPPPPGPLQGDYIMAMNRSVLGVCMLVFSACAPGALPFGTWAMPILAWLACGAALFEFLVLAPRWNLLRRSIALALDVGGTPFQRNVWRALGAIPAGTTSTYAEVARAIGRPAAARAVAAACAANAIAVAIPCHRVVRSDGSLSGYRWGVARKRRLLASESGGPS